jgi:hypothetical protein
VVRAINTQNIEAADQQGRLLIARSRSTRWGRPL